MSRADIDTAQRTAALQAAVAYRFIEFYRRDQRRASRLADEEIDRSGSLLGWVRELARSDFARGEQP